MERTLAFRDYCIDLLLLPRAGRFLKARLAAQHPEAFSEADAALRAELEAEEAEREGEGER